MSWSRKGKMPEKLNDVWSFEEPESKKRKLGIDEQEADDWGDDSLELTQAEIESLDVIASQALNTVPDQSTSKIPFTRPSNPVKLSVNKSSSSSDSSLRPSSSSDLSTSQSLHSSASCGSVPKLEGKQTWTVKGYEETLEKKNTEIRNVLDQKYRSEGEVKILRQTLKKKDAEIEKLRTERNAEDDKRRKEQSDKERQLKLQVEKLTSEAQFNEREYQEMIRNLEKRLREKDERLKTSSSASSPSSKEAKISKISSPQKVPVAPSPPGKYKLQKSDEGFIGSQQQLFPTQSSFMEKPPIQSPSSKTSPVVKTNKSTSCQALFADPSRKKDSPSQKARRLQLNNAAGTVTLGADIVLELIQPYGSANSDGDPGLPGLLQTMSTSLTVDSLTYSRNRDSSTLSPLKPKRRSHFQGFGPSLSGDSGYVQVVSSESYHMAIQGLEMLLHKSKQQSGQKDRGSSYTSPSSVSSDSRASGTEDISALTHPHSGAILLLPMLSDYLHHYMEMIHSALPKAAVSKSPNTTPVFNTTTNQPGSLGMDSLSLHTGSSSYDSSLDSLSSCVLHLLQEGKVFALALERYALSALKCCNILLQLCPSVTSVLAHHSLAAAKTDKQDISTKSILSTKTAAKMEPPQRKSESGTDADDEKSTSSSEIRIIASFSKSAPSVITTGNPPSFENSSRLLLYVIRLAGENLEESNASPLIIEESLQVLNHLCSNCSKEEFSRIELVLLTDTLSAALKQSKHPQVLVQAQDLCGLFIFRCQNTSKLCTKSESCPLYNMYRLCGDPYTHDLQPASLQVYSAHVNIISSIISHHRSRLSSLLVNSCACSDELVTSTILAMYKILLAYKAKGNYSADKESLLYTLLQGILVLHCLAQADGSFLQRHAPVQLSYVRLLSGLSSILRPVRSEWEWHATVLDELCDFEPEFQETSSQDSEGEDRMDQS